MNNLGKRAICIAIFALGMAGGLVGCVVALPAIFAIGINDSAPEILGVMLLSTLLPACFTALWWRKLASFWLAFVGLFWIYGVVWQEHYLSAVRHFTSGRLLDTLGKEAIPSYFALAIAAFGLITERRGWPQLIQRNLTEAIFNPVSAIAAAIFSSATPCLRKLSVRLATIDPSSHSRSFRSPSPT
jgi:hypothetical protein